MGLTLIFGVLDIVNFAHGAFLRAGPVRHVLARLASVRDAPHARARRLRSSVMFVLGAARPARRPRRRDRKAAGEPAAHHAGTRDDHREPLLLFFGADPRRSALPGDTGVPILGAVADLSRLLAFGGALVLAGLLTCCCSARGWERRSGRSRPTTPAPQLVGIDTRRIYMLTFAIGTACAGAAGVLVAPLVTIEPTTGELFNIIAFVVVVLGGMGNVIGALRRRPADRPHRAARRAAAAGSEPPAVDVHRLRARALLAPAGPVREVRR